jgi:UDP-glucose 4-epimerase
VTVLVTGDRGRLGAAIRARLEGEGVTVRGFDAAAGDDVLDAPAVRAAARGCSAIVHLAGLAEDRGGAPEEFMAVNVLGTYHVLLAAREANAGRVVHASSGKALGMLERDPAYLPIDDAHPGLPSRPYGLSKWLSEELCEAFTRETGIATVCLRPVLVLDAAGWAGVAGADELPPARGPSWHLGVFVDVDDVADAFVAALRCPDPGHARLLLCADEIAARRPTAQLVADHLPQVPWRDGRPFAADSRRALVDCAAARAVLGWEPRRGWR